ncbi:MAG: MG2 domain-containing protein [Flavobacteriaceae bacterium]
MQKSITLLMTLFIFSIIANAQDDQPNNYEKDWESVEKLELQGLPKSALELVESIYKKATKSGNQPQIIKSLLYKSKFALTVEEDAQLNVINDLNKEIANAKFPVKNILESILADLYWQYFQQNRWKFYNRTHTDEKVDSTDFRTWDLETLFAETQLHYEKSLENALLLQQEPLTKYDALLVLAENSKKYRPTLYDLLANRVLDFLKTDERNLNKPAYKFEIDNLNFLADNEQFTKLEIASKDSTSQELLTLKLYKNLTLFHQRDTNPDALVAVTLDRLQFVKNKAVFNDVTTVYLQTLNQLKEQFKNNEVVTQIYYQIASQLNLEADQYNPKNGEDNRWKRKEALAICEEAIAKFPSSFGAENCKALTSSILTENINITHENYVPINKKSRLLVSYKNVEKLYFNLYPISQKEYAEFNTIYNDSARIEFIKKLKIHKQWNADLRNENDYQQHTSEVVIPELNSGHYLIYTSTKEGLNKDNSYAYGFLQATDLVLVENDIQTQNLYQVVNRNTGQPVANASVRLKNDVDRYDKPFDRTFVTDSKGFFEFNNNDYYYNITATVTHKNDKAFFGDYYLNRNYNRTKQSYNEGRIFLFTDRSIYRPGQTVHFKGIAVAIKDNKSSVITDKKVFVNLQDVNYQVVQSLEFKTNEFGSFSGQFVLPSSGLTGNFGINASGNTGFLSKKMNGYASFSVEEYKRPKFEVSFLPVIETFKINDSVTVTGNAKAFAGSTITDAKVVYRVYRTPQFSEWYWYRRPQYNYEEMEITHGETITDADGNFSIDFKAIPDLSISKESLPIFNYRITADVTDINGETRSTSTQVNVGYHMLNATIVTDFKLNKKEKNHTIMVSTTNLNGQPVAAKGLLSIYKLQAPEHVLRKRPWEAPDYQLLSKEEFKEYFPHDAYTNEDDLYNRAKGNMFFSADVNTDKTTEVTLKNISKWTSGNYIILFESKDKNGQLVKDEKYITVFSESDKKLADNELFSIKTDKDSYSVGETAKISLGSASKDISVVLTIEKDDKKDTRILHLSDDIQTINIPVNEKDLGGFSINYYYVNNNEFNSGRLLVKVPYPNKELTVETNTFRDKLQPGQEETWSFTIKGPKGDKVAAEVLASMYDASLDQFRGHYWSFNPIYHPYNYNYNRANANHSFGNDNFTYYGKYQQLSYKQQSYDQLNWFGFSFDGFQWVNNTYLRGLKNKYNFTNQTTYSYDNTKPEGYIYGKVSDEGGLLPGVSIIVKGTTNGTQTDFDGNFSLAANEGDTVVFSFVGMTTVEVVVSKNNIYNIVMEADSASLDEVITVGYGVTKETSLRIRGKASGIQVEADEAVEEEVVEGIPFAMVSSPKESSTPKKENLQGIVARKNLQETAFFYPHLTTDEKGNVSFTFTTPESLTKWNLQLLTHTKELSYATTRFSTVTQKELMVLPNPPRFFREGDQLTFASKIANLSDKALNGVSELQLFDALTNKPIDAKLGNANNQKSFTVDAKGNANINWTLTIPDDVQAVKYRIVAKAGEFSDGEENALPVLSNRMLVTETLPMWLRSGQTKTFTLDKLKSNTSTTLKNHNLTLEITSNPAWYAVQALPYLIEYPYECAEQTFSRYYANALASHIVNSNPRIKEVFDQWKSSDALLSNLEKNEELKSMIIEETPWLRNAQSETEQKKRIALLFDLNKMNSELNSAIRKLEQLQMNNGGFPWFKGSNYPNRYITQHITTGFGHLNKLNVTSNGREKSIIQNAVSFLDNEILNDYQELEKQAKRIRESAKTKTEGTKLEAKFWTQDHTSYIQIHYLYTRSFYGDVKIPAKAQKAVDYFTEQAYQFWLKNNLYTKGLIALTAHRNGNSLLAEKITRSLKENSVNNEELGMYWKENTASWFWYQAPVETQALMIEVFSEIENDTKTIDDLKVWLLKNKQTNQWPTTKATAEAVYALLLQGTDWLEVTELADVAIGNKKIDPMQLEDTKVEAGTGYFKTSWKGAEIQPEMASVTLKKQSEGIAWGAMYWQYFEDLDKITPAETPLKLKKKLFLKKNTDKGEELFEINDKTSLKLGDLVRVRIELKVDRAMEFVHMKDMRAAGFEPVNVLSQYKWQDGLGYYESTKDAATNFFFDYLPKGVYIFEYNLRVNNKGDFSNGITTIQSMYAPEFSSHSEGVRVKVD